ncbi:MAG: bifunctional D-glycero-beta-D-manno-heptose-7-phosphate kinase/D-glycero-beta-D-manno-heptose 1-phosphate adenylyltransferase HldE [Cycloclasticus sp.]|nr:bifunctional D-glycero-beta-D-manno-heptose-7-phosphate kinase/D-glycero-beta-D-manno-heptose 1-phosphate adenylyltransferase HldE [Cycloclasticus sp.]MBQ0790555.1 bifunctional D-glycero-beta-D-manno-heptose-7-phosphate kinase/D-glycero-beta-D-manno-heptose 1-phosphate adenylyltransferase HldE [Cycloclasticus sp.]
MKLPNYSQASVLVVGDLMLDRNWQGDTSRISPEAPVPVVHVQSVDDRPGGAGNVALNIAALESSVTVLGYTGSDDAASSLHSLLEKAGVQCQFEQLTDQPTITKLRILSRHQQLIRLDFEDSFHDLPSDQLLQHFTQALPAHDVVILSDYGKGTLASAQQLILAAKAAGKKVLVDPKGSDFTKYSGATLITPNWNEFQAVVGECKTDEDLVSLGTALMQSLQLEALLITRGEKGMSLLQPQQAAIHLPTQAREVFDVTGAGDTVISTLAASLAAGASFSEATVLANQAAGLVVAKLGTATVSQQELKATLHTLDDMPRGFVDSNQLELAINTARINGEKIVLTNGCFDILHPGHVRYLQQAKALGDRLIILVNDDASVSRLKGPERPINDLATRAEMLSALACVDWVCAFAEDSPRDHICRILPDVLVKGGDYKRIEDIEGHDCVAEAGGSTYVLDYVDGCSTTNLIKNIRNTSDKR